MTFTWGFTPGCHMVGFQPEGKSPAAYNPVTSL